MLIDKKQRSDNGVSGNQRPEPKKELQFIHHPSISLEMKKMIIKTADVFVSDRGYKSYLLSEGVFITISDNIKGSQKARLDFDKTFDTGNVNLLFQARSVKDCNIMFRILMVMRK